MAERLTPQKRLEALQAEIDAEKKASEAKAAEQQDLENKKAEEERIKNEEAEKSNGQNKGDENGGEENGGNENSGDENNNGNNNDNPPKVEKTWEEVLAEEKKLEQEEKKKARLAALAESKMANLFLELEEEGKSIEEIASIANKLKSFDTKDLTDEELFMMIVSEEKNSEGEPLTAEEKSLAYESFKELSASVQKTTLEAKRKEIEEKRKSEIEKYSNNKKSALTKVNECLPLIESKAKEIYGTEVNGVFMTADLTKEFNKEASRQLVSCTDVKGDINAQKAISNALKIVLYDSIEAKAKEAGEKAGLEKAFRENHNPSEDGKIAKSQSTQQKTKEEKEDEAARAYIASRNPQRKKSLQST